MHGAAFVALGGAVGAVLRYFAGFLPISGSFPFATMLVNFLGAFLIGAVTGFASAGKLAPDAVLFLKTGLCGGFTTFSTFSLETLTLIEKGKLLTASVYAFGSLLGCLAGVKLGSCTAAFILNK